MYITAVCQKEQRLEVEASLRNGTLRLLCATSSMELGIDVGSMIRFYRLAAPRSISSTMQRLGRAGHNPGQTSYMFMYPRTSQETLFCGMSAAVAKAGGIEQASPPKKCPGCSGTASRLHGRNRKQFPYGA